MADLTDVQLADRTHTLIVAALGRREHLGVVMGATNAADRTMALRGLANLLLELALDDDPHTAGAGAQGLALLSAGVGVTPLQENRHA